MRATIYLGRKELRCYLEKRGYTTTTLRKIITTEFGYHNTSHILDSFKNISRGVLDITVSYKSKDEYRNIALLISMTLQYLKNDSNNRVYGRDIVFINPEFKYNFGYHTGDREKTLYYYTEAVVFKREFLNEINEKLELNEIRMSI